VGNFNREGKTSLECESVMESESLEILKFLGKIIVGASVGVSVVFYFMKDKLKELSEKNASLTKDILKIKDEIIEEQKQKLAAIETSKQLKNNLEYERQFTRDLKNQKLNLETKLRRANGKENT